MIPPEKREEVMNDMLFDPQAYLDGVPEDIRDMVKDLAEEHGMEKAVEFAREWMGEDGEGSEESLDPTEIDRMERGLAKSRPTQKQIEQEEAEKPLPKIYTADGQLI